MADGLKRKKSLKGSSTLVLSECIASDSWWRFDMCKLTVAPRWCISAQQCLARLGCAALFVVGHMLLLLLSCSHAVIHRRQQSYLELCSAQVIAITQGRCTKAVHLNHNSVLLG